MRAREFITEEMSLPPEQADPMQDTYSIPGLSGSDPYAIYRLGVAMARARSDSVKDDINPYMPPWTNQTVFGENGVIVGFNNTVAPIIDQALKMTKTAGGKKLVSAQNSKEPSFVITQSPVKPFKGYSS